MSQLGDDGSCCMTWRLHGKNTYRLGRDANNDVMLPFSWVSRKHAMIQVEANGSHHIIDLGSSNGTFVNGNRVYTPTTLHSGDQIKIGNTLLSFYQKGKVAEATDVYDDADDRTVAFVQKEIVTILICDIHDYTHLSEVLGNRRLSKLLQYWTGKVNTIVRKNEGSVDKFIGDAVMAIWSGGPSVGHRINQALKAALDINIFTHHLSHKIPDMPWELEIGAALNTGEAMMGNIGVDGRRDYTVVGDVVNVAFRLESLTSRAEGIDFIMGADAVAHVRSIEQYLAPKRVTVKGKSESILSYVGSFDQLQEYLAAGGGTLG